MASKPTLTSRNATRVSHCLLSERIVAELVLVNREGLHELHNVWSWRRAFGNRSSRRMVWIKSFERKVKDPLQDIKQQLLEAAIARSHGEQQVEQRLQALMTELKGMQTQLLEVTAMQQGLSVQWQQSMLSMRQFIVEVNTRLFPTTFVCVA